MIELAPENVRFLLPVYEVTMLPESSLAVIVRFWLTPAVWFGLPVMTRWVAMGAT